jgi:hypothetical protein
MAIHYFNAIGNYYITTNYKVLFSTFEALDMLKRVFDPDVVKNHDHGNSRPAERRPHYMLTRNPYDRLESFFRDKFRQHPEGVDVTAPFEWQRCQKMFSELLGFHSESSTEEVRDKFLNCSFTDFMRYLPQVWQLDGHLFPQHQAHLAKVGKRIEKLVFDRYLKIEREEDRAFLREKLGIDTHVVRNSTKDVRAMIEWTAAARMVANTIYQEDFIVLQYPMH